MKLRSPSLRQVKTLDGLVHDVVLIPHTQFRRTVCCTLEQIALADVTAHSLRVLTCFECIENRTAKFPPGTIVRRAPEIGDYRLYVVVRPLAMGSRVFSQIVAVGEGFFTSEDEASLRSTSSRYTYVPR